MYTNYSFDSRNFGNLCDRVFREQSKHSQRQKFGARDKQEALRSLETQQRNLQQLKEKKGGVFAQLPPIKKHARVSAKRMSRSISTVESRNKGFLKKIVEIGNERLVVMLKSIEVTAVVNESAAVAVKTAKRARKISTLIGFHDMHYLFTYCSFDEIVELFQKHTYVQNDQIVVDYKTFTAQPRVVSDSLNDEQPVYPERFSEEQVDASKNSGNSNEYNGKYTFKIEFPHIEFYVSNLAHKQKVFLDRSQIGNLSAGNFDDINMFIGQFDQEWMLQEQEQMAQQYHDGGDSPGYSPEPSEDEYNTMALQNRIENQVERLDTINEQNTPLHNKDSFDEGNSMDEYWKERDQQQTQEEGDQSNQQVEQEEEAEEQDEAYEANQMGDSQADQFEVPEFTIEDRDENQPEVDLSEASTYQTIEYNGINYLFGFKSLEIILTPPEEDAGIVKQLSFLQLYNLILAAKEDHALRFLTYNLSISSDGEIMLQLEENPLNEEECLALEEQDFVNFLDSLVGTEIELDDISYSLNFSKPSIEVLEKDGQNSKIIEVDGVTLLNIIQRAFNFTFVVNS